MAGSVDCAELSRRDFLGGFISLGMLGGCAFPAPPGVFSHGTPALRFGLLSDVHISMKDVDGKWANDAGKFVHALKWFRKMGVDAVVNAGDLANFGMTEELQAMADAWDEVFPGGKSPDGRDVARIFVTGNHDYEGAIYGGGFAGKLYPDAAERGGKVFFPNRRNQWERIFREPYEPIFSKRVKGYTFIGQHWDPPGWKGSGSFGLVKPWMEKNGAALAADGKPFFYVQHAVLRRTCNGPDAWGQDTGIATATLSEYPNAIAFSGHSHYTLTDESSIWQDGFTAVNASSMWYTGKPNLGNPDAPRPKMRVSQGALVEVYGDRVVIARRQFLPDESLGDDWVIPLPVAGRKPFEPKSRAASAAVPQFAPDAVVRTAFKSGTLRVSFPQALACAEARPFRYSVRVETAEGATQSREFMDPRFNRPPSALQCEGFVEVSFKGNLLPKGSAYRVTVSPGGSLGGYGSAIESGWTPGGVKA